MGKENLNLNKMSYDRNSNDPLSDYEVEAPINNLDENSVGIAVNKIARAWEQLDCAHTQVATEKSGGGFYLSCGNFRKCKEPSYFFHIHIFCDGKVSLKESIDPAPEDVVSKDIEYRQFDSEKNGTLFFEEDGATYLPRHVKETSLQIMTRACPELNPFDAKKFAALLYLWAGYNNTENCTMIDFIRKYENFIQECDDDCKSAIINS